MINGKIMSRILIPVILLVLVFGGAGYYFINNQANYSSVPLPTGKVCEKDSLVCEDGTVLKREGPNCSFPPCPSTESGEFNKEVTIIGTTICLPHKNSNGPQTLECALGIQADNGNNYGLTDPGWKFLIGTGNGFKVKITGRLTKSQADKYDSAGVIEISNLEKIN